MIKKRTDIGYLLFIVSRGSGHISQHQFLIVHYCIYRVSPKTNLTLTLYFEAMTIKMLKSLGLLVSLDLYNSFDILLVCFHELMNKFE